MGRKVSVKKAVFCSKSLAYKLDKSCQVALDVYINSGITKPDLPEFAAKRNPLTII